MSARKFIIKIDPSSLVPKSSARIFYYGAFWLIIVQIVVMAFLYPRVPRVVPLFFTEPWGEGRLAPKMLLALLPIASFISLVINLAIGKRVKEESNLLPYSLAVGTLMIVLMFSIALGGILQSII